MPNEENSVVEVTTEEVAEPQKGAQEPEQPETETGTNESDTTPQEPEIPNEVWKTARIKAEKEAEIKTQKRIDEFYANMYGEYGVKTEEDYKKLMAKQEEDARTERLTNAGITQEDILGMINGLPEMQTMKNIAAAQEEKFRQEALDYAVKEIATIDPDIKSFEDLEKSPNAEAFNTLVEKGYTLKDAYKLANYDKLVTKSANEAKAKLQEQINQNGAASPGSLTGTPETQNVHYEKLTEEEFEKYIQKAIRGELSQS